MIILAIDTSSKSASCALLSNGIVVGEFFVNAGITHSQTIIPMVEALLINCNTDITQVDLFAISVGPGSFTGLRIGVSAVKGMAMGCEKLCVAVSTLESLAQNMVSHIGIIVSVMDARRSQVYSAMFRSNGKNITRISEDVVIIIKDLGDKLSTINEPIVFVGDGAEICAQEIGYEICPQFLQHQRASSVALLAANLEPILPDYLEPIYLQLPQAQRELLEKREV